jgi:hypothetical protein
VNAQTANYTLDVADAGKLVTMSNTSARTITVPTNATAAIPVGTIIYLANINTGAVTVAPASTVTVNALSALRVLNRQHSAAFLIKTDTNTWFMTVTTRGLG